MKNRKKAAVWTLALILALTIFACSNQPNAAKSDTITISGTLTLPTVQTNKFWVVGMFTNTLSMATCITNIYGYHTGSVVSFSASGLPKGDYLFFAGVDVNGDMTTGNSGDYSASYPGLGTINLTEDASFNIPLSVVP